MTGRFDQQKKSGLEIRKTKKGKGTKIMLMTEAEGVPISLFTTILLFTTSAQVADVNMIETLVEQHILGPTPKPLIYD